ncbi:hypothetical protein [Mucilaginibacter sp. R-33]|uniref:hypothetical protein n=1 Tax=unclassified Mucilaginibacter TaxID=2617802 RepID=UPI003CF191F4
MDNIVLSVFFQAFLLARRHGLVENSAIFVIFVYKRQNIKAIPAHSAQLFDADLFYSPLIPLLPGT